MLKRIYIYDNRYGYTSPASPIYIYTHTLLKWQRREKKTREKPMDCLAIASPGCQLYSLSIFSAKNHSLTCMFRIFLSTSWKRKQACPLHYLSCTCPNQDVLWWRQNHTTGQIWELYLGFFSVFSYDRLIFF